MLRLVLLVFASVLFISLLASEAEGRGGGRGGGGRGGGSRSSSRGGSRSSSRGGSGGLPRAKGGMSGVNTAGMQGGGALPEIVMDIIIIIGLLISIGLFFYCCKR